MNIEHIKELLFCFMIPGAAGALTWFLCGIKHNWIRNNKIKRKAVLEIIGGMLVASFIGYPLSTLLAKSIPIKLISFAIGTSWSGIIQLIRNWITNSINKYLDKD